MAYDTKLADRVRAYLSEIPRLNFKEKVWFQLCLAFNPKEKASKK